MIVFKCRHLGLSTTSCLVLSLSTSKYSKSIERGSDFQAVPKVTWCLASILTMQINLIATTCRCSSQLGEGVSVIFIRSDPPACPDSNYLAREHSWVMARMNG
jgi:hypothetical protein